MKTNEIIFHASRAKAVLLLLGSVAFVAMGWWMKEKDPLIGWLGVVFFSLGIPAAVIMFLPGAVYLRLDREGLEMKSIGRKHRILWKDVQSFKICSVSGAKMIAINYRPQYKDQKVARVVVRAVSGMEGAISNSYNVSLVDLERALNKWLERFGRDET